ncbi:glycosyltransferase family 2 protein [Methanoculleus sp. FWC-SCC3]|uniref:Glycosyltransferase family 2 protein n=1 Tax=Methanoculleus methanifontis TaxID=2584086 RepID=A0ABT8M4Q0_9EURY|nr:glycosyltransferase family 2 protein [Methanoculleus sp. FWC-SCC3]MDN7013578.1 glycosyltransferase family 2 protein [Methanoculleus sp. FWC-SCC3]
MQVKTSIIILNYCSLNDTENLVAQLLDIKDNVQIIIVDNGSPDDSYNHLMARFGSCSNVYLIRNECNLGYASGNNVGIRYALETLKSPYIAIMNPDVEVAEDYFRNMMGYLEADQKIAAITGIMLDRHSTLHVASIAWKIPSNLDDVFLSSGLLRRMYNPVKYDTFSNISHVNPGIYYVDTIPGSCFVIRSTVLKEVDLLDEETFLYCEERILAKKVKDIGLTNAISINDIFIHKHVEKKHDLKQALQHYYWVSTSRLYYNMKYSNLGKISYICLPLIVLSILLGFTELVFVHPIRWLRSLLKI